MSQCPKDHQIKKLGCEKSLCVRKTRWSDAARSGAVSLKTSRMPANLNEPVFWHIDRFEVEEPARAAIGPASIAFEFHDAERLMSVDWESNDQKGGEHVAVVKLSPLPEAAKYSMLVSRCLTQMGHRSFVLPPPHLR